MYGDEVREAALKMRREGVQVKVMARQLGVSDGWASMATTEVKDEIDGARPLKANDVAMSVDARAHASGRSRRVGELSARRKTSLQGRLDELTMAMAMASDGGWRIPHWSSSEYKVLDKFQQMFSKDEQHPIFGLMEQAWPEMLSHLVEWKRVRRSPDKSEEGFREAARRVHDYVMRERRAPSIADRDLVVQEAARWLWRWKCSANGRVGRKRNVERAELFTEIGIIVEMLSSPVPAVHKTGCECIDSGRWTSLFHALMVNRQSVPYSN